MLPHLEFHLDLGVTAWRGIVEEPEMKNQVMGIPPVPSIYFKNCVTQRKLWEHLARVLAPILSW